MFWSVQDIEGCTLHTYAGLSVSPHWFYMCRNSEACAIYKKKKGEITFQAGHGDVCLYPNMRHLLHNVTERLHFSSAQCKSHAWGQFADSLWRLEAAAAAANCWPQIWCLFAEKLRKRWIGSFLELFWSFMNLYQSRRQAEIQSI